MDSTSGRVGRHDMQLTQRAEPKRPAMKIASLYKKERVNEWTSQRKVKKETRELQTFQQMLREEEPSQQDGPCR